MNIIDIIVVLWYVIALGAMWLLAYLFYKRKLKILWDEIKRQERAIKLLKHDLYVREQACIQQQIKGSEVQKELNELKRAIGFEI